MIGHTFFEIEQLLNEARDLIADAAHEAATRETVMAEYRRAAADADSAGDRAYLQYVADALLLDACFSASHYGYGGE